MDGATLDAATRYICSLEIIKVQLQIWMVKDEELETHLAGNQCFAEQASIGTMSLPFYSGSHDS